MSFFVLMLGISLLAYIPQFFLVIANVNVALKGESVQGLEFGPWYYWLRLLFQPIFIIWALYVSGVIGERDKGAEMDATAVVPQ